MELLKLIEQTAEGLGYELVDFETSPRGRLMRVFIDSPNGITVDDCATVSNQLTRIFEVENVEYDRLEVSSPGLDRALKKPADFERFAGAEVEITLKVVFQGRKKYHGVLRLADAGGCELVFKDGKEDKVLGFALEEIREARLVPVVDFKGRNRRAAAPQEPVAGTGGHEE